MASEVLPVLRCYVIDDTWKIYEWDRGWNFFTLNPQKLSRFHLEDSPSEEMPQNAIFSSSFSGPVLFIFKTQPETHLQEGDCDERVIFSLTCTTVLICTSQYSIQKTSIKCKNIFKFLLQALNIKHAENIIPNSREIRDLRERETQNII